MSGAGIARLVLRAAVGGTMVAHGLRHGRTLAGTAVGNLAAASVALAALGPGRFSVDRRRGLEEWATPAGRAALTAGLGLTAAAAQLLTFWRRPPGPA